MAKKEITPDMFKDITFRRKDIPGTHISRYRIYTGKDSFTMVEAENAKAAVDASGIKNPLRVLPDSLYLDNVLNSDVFMDITEKKADATTTTAKITPADESNMIALTSDDVDRLLHGKEEGATPSA